MIGKILGDFLPPFAAIFAILPYIQKILQKSSEGVRKWSGCQKTGNYLNFSKKNIGVGFGHFRLVMTKNRSGDQNRGKGRGGFKKWPQLDIVPKCLNYTI